MDLIDEEDDLACAVDHFLDYSFQAFLKFSLVLRACDQGSHIQGIYHLALEVLRDVAVDDLAGDSLRNRRLADAWFTNEDRVVLCPPAQYLEDTTDLVIPSDDGIEFSRGRLFIEVHGVLGKELQFAVRVFHNVAPFFNIAAQELPARPSNNRKAGASLPVSAAALCKQLPDRTLPAPGAGITKKGCPACGQTS